MLLRLEVREVCRLRCVCRRLAVVGASEELWARYAEARGWQRCEGQSFCETALWHAAGGVWHQHKAVHAGLYYDQYAHDFLWVQAGEWLEHDACVLVSENNFAELVRLHQLFDVRYIRMTR